MITSMVESAMAEYPGYSVVFTGHSYGAALAGIAATVFRNSGYTIELVGEAYEQLIDIFISFGEFITDPGSV